MRIRQIVFAARDLADARATLADLLQMPPPFRDPGVAEFGIDNAVFCFGDQFIEVVSPVREGSACARHLDRQDDSGYMLLLQTDDLARDRARFARLGLRTIWSAEHDDISAMHLHPKDVGAAIVSVDEPRPPTAWRWGGPDWRVADGPAGEQRVRGLTVQALDPEAMAHRWSEIFDRPVPLSEGAGSWRITLDGGFVDFYPSSDGREGITGFTLGVADVEGVIARAQGHGLPVDVLRVQVLGTWLALEPL